MATTDTVALMFTSFADQGELLGRPESQSLDHVQTIPRVGRPEDIAPMVLFLASDESEWVTGQAMIVDGGLTVGPNTSALAAVAPTPPTQGAYVGPSFKR